jgi:hypothetical protein
MNLKKKLLRLTTVLLLTCLALAPLFAGGKAEAEGAKKFRIG